MTSPGIAGDGAGPGVLPIGEVSRRTGISVAGLRKPLLLALTRAIEVECAARAQQPVLIGSLQRERFYQAPASRWAFCPGLTGPRACLAIAVRAVVN